MAVHTIEQIEAMRAESARLQAEIDARAAYDRLMAENEAMGPCQHDAPRIAGIDGDDRSGYMALCDYCLEPFRDATRDEIDDASEAYWEAKNG